MNHWFLRENPRRFLRMDMPVHIYVSPSAPIDNLEIYATGANYITPSILQNIINQNNLIYSHLAKIETILTPIFEEIIQAILLLGKGVEDVSKGINPCKNIEKTQAIKKALTGFEQLKGLAIKAPKTYQYLKLIEEKYLFFLNAFFTTIKQSSAEAFEVNFNLKQGFRLDETIQEFHLAKDDNSPLIKTIIALSKFMDYYIVLYLSLNQDHLLRQDTGRWLLTEVNLSACGIALNTSKYFKNHQKIDVFFSFPENKKILTLSGSIVGIQQQKSSQERIAIDFYFPKRAEQEFLIFKIQEYELDQCITNDKKDI